MLYFWYLVPDGRNPLGVVGHEFRDTGAVLQRGRGVKEGGLLPGVIKRPTKIGKPECSQPKGRVTKVLLSYWERSEGAPNENRQNLFC